MAKVYFCPCGRAPIKDNPARCIAHKGMSLPEILAREAARLRAGLPHPAGSIHRA